MTKSEMAAKLAKNCDLSQAKALEVVNCIFETSPGQGIIAIELDAGREVRITGFGTFGTKRRSARSGRNPATGETINISASRYVRFKNSQNLKDRL